MEGKTKIYKNGGVCIAIKNGLQFKAIDVEGTHLKKL